eukprot:92022_1
MESSPREKRTYSLFWRFCRLIKNVFLFIPVYIVLAIVGMDYYSLMMLSIPHHFQTSPIMAILLAAVFNLSVALMLASYARTIFTSTFVSAHAPPSSLSSVALPNCSKCGYFKPDRTHHCSMCGECVLKMDHHCPWVANCVGYHNYKYFCLFIFWSCISAIIFVAGSVDHLLGIFGGRISPTSFVPLFSSILTSAFSITLLGFLGFHLNLVLTSQTTLEFSLSSSRPRNWRSPYDLGSKRANFESVFGRSPWQWLLPVPVNDHSGYEFHQQLNSDEMHDLESGHLLRGPLPSVDISS